VKWLVKEGYLQRIPVQGIEDIFKINPGKAQDAEDFISAGQDDSDARKK
jgi:hypothetical protein